MNHIDMKYVGIISTKLDRFKVKSTNPYKANCRCPICGDSKKSKAKTRGWILEKPKVTLYYCHNCGSSMSLKNFIRYIDPNIFDDYIKDSLIEKNSSPTLKAPEKFDFQPSIESKNDSLKDLDKVSSLSPTHIAKKYVTSRKIPSYRHYKIYYADDFNAWVNSIIPGKLPDIKERRIVLPFLDKDENLFGFTARSLSKSSKMRYITIMLDEDREKVFGLDTVNFSKKYYVVEGPIDSLFLSNSVAIAGASSDLSSLKNKDKATFVFDNEPRNPQIIKHMDRCIKNGFKVCIWNENESEKDINDMILSGRSPLDIRRQIDDNTYGNLDAALRLSFWKKC